MSPAPAAVRTKIAASYNFEQRSHQRYPIALDLEYKLMPQGRAEKLGHGRTVNICSGGVLIETEDPLPADSPIEVLIHWPFLLAGVCPLKLVMRGRIVRNDDRGVAIQIVFHEFRTAGARASKKSLLDLRARSRGR